MIFLNYNCQPMYAYTYTHILCIANHHGRLVGTDQASRLIGSESAS